MLVMVINFRVIDIGSEEDSPKFRATGLPLLHTVYLSLLVSGGSFWIEVRNTAN